MLTDKALYRNLYKGALAHPVTGSHCMNPNFMNYGENGDLLLVSISDSGYLLHLDREEVTYIGCFYGDVVCGLVARDANWVVMGGFDLFTVWRLGILTNVPIKSAFDVRQTGPGTVQILTDPWWSDAPAIWELDITTLQLKMIRLFKDYKGKEETNVVVW